LEIDRRVTHLDIAPTVAAFLGFRAEQAEGAPLKELLS
jgi:arylsulfatase A-like enzyme